MRAQKTWVIAALGSFIILLAGQPKSAAATSAIYFDDKGNSHALDETLKNPFDAKSKEGKLVDAFLAELKKYKLCKIIFDGDTTSSTADLEKKIDKDTQAATAAHNAKAAATCLGAKRAVSPSTSPAGAYSPRWIFTCSISPSTGARTSRRSSSVSVAFT